MKTRGTGLLMVWTDIDPTHEADFNAWYDQEHLAAMLALLGVLNAGRYRALSGGPKYLAAYELEDAGVLQTDAYRVLLYTPSAWRQKAAGSHIGRNFIRNGYRQIYPARSHPIDLTMEMPPFFQIGRMDMPAAIEEEFNEWYNTAYIPVYLKIPGCLGARRFVAVDGQPRYMTVYDLATPDLRSTPQWDEARKSNPWSKRLQPLGHDENSPGIYERISPGLVRKA